MENHHEKTSTHIAVIPSAGFSHLVPILEFSKRLVHHHPDFHVTCIIPSLGSPSPSTIAYLESLPSNINSVFLPPISKSEMPPGSHIVVQLQQVVSMSLPSMYDVLTSLNSKTPLAAIVADMFAFAALDFAKELNTLSFLYSPISCMSLSLGFCLPNLDKNILCEFKDLSEPIKIPGCVPINATDLPDAAQDRSSQAYKHFYKLCSGFSRVDGVLVNSFMEMEEGPIRGVTEDGCENPPVYPIGPITQSQQNKDEKETSESECVRWLDNQAPYSVLYVSFGSGGTLSQEQINELAFGLEQSGKKFLWVLRAPSNASNFAAYLGSKSDDPLQYLPEGFLERTKDQGLVVASWAPQIEILSHSSIGGFLSHCGWNSTLESVEQGVPLMTWPLFGDQRMNAVWLTEGLKVGLRPKVNKNNGMIERDEISEVIKNLMEGEGGKEIRKRMKDLKFAAANAIKEDGSSTKVLAQVARKWRNFNRN